MWLSKPPHRDSIYQQRETKPTSVFLLLCPPKFLRRYVLVCVHFEK